MALLIASKDGRVCTSLARFFLDLAFSLLIVFQ